MTASTLFFALSGGILPSLLWLWFWLQEDRLHPEPRGLIIRTFIAGMIAVPLVLLLERKIQDVYYAFDPMLVIFLWAAAEELFKWGAAFFAGLTSKDYDEPIDAVIYLLTAALGFAAIENTFFLISSIAKMPLTASLLTGNLRFIGATLLHVLTSGVVGYSIGASFCRGWFGRQLHLAIGLGTAILLHTVFNIYIMRSTGSTIFIVFCFVWVAILLLIAGFQKVKKTKAVCEDKF